MKNTAQLIKSHGSLTEIIQRLETGDRSDFEVIGEDIPQSYPHLLSLAVKYGASLSLSGDGSSAMFSFEQSTALRISASRRQ